MSVKKNSNFNPSKIKENIKVEQFPDFYFELPKKDEGVKQALRRLSQMSQIFTSPAFTDQKSIQYSTCSRYSSEQEIRYYRELALWGFHDYEKIIALELLKELKNELHQNTFSKALVVGCGAGREIFALSEMGLGDDFTGIDICSEMLTEAENIAISKKLNVNFLNQSAEQLLNSKNSRFDLIWVTASLDAHLQGRKNRIRFYKTIDKLLSGNGKAVLIPSLDQSLSKTRKIGSQLLRLRWAFKNKWEPGDTATSFMGIHNDSSQMLYLHFYNSKEHFLEEISAAGLNAKQVETKLPHNYTEIEGWILGKSHA